MVLIFDFLRFEASGLRVRMSRANIQTMVTGAISLVASFCTIYAVCGDWPTAHKSKVAWGWLQHQRLAVMLGALLLIYGAPILLFLSGWGVPRIVRLSRPANLCAFFAATLPVAAVGGQDTERFLYWYMALIILMLLPTIDGLWRARERTLLLVTMMIFSAGHRIYMPMNPAGLTAGCTITDFLSGTSPYTGSYTKLCEAATIREIITIFSLAVLLVLLRKTRWDLPSASKHGVRAEASTKSMLL